MDAEHRHELKTNELADFLGHLPDFFRKYSNQIIGIILILVALIVVPMYTRMRKQTSLADEAATISKIQMARDSLARVAQDATSANPALPLAAETEDLDEAAQTTKNGNLAALALLKEAELLRAELHLRPDVTADMISANLSKARTACEQALEKAQTPTLKGLAELGLGLCDEEAGEYDKARAIYETLIAKPEYEGTAVIEQAKRRLASLEDNSAPVTFVQTEESVQPESETETMTPPTGSAENILPTMRSTEPVMPPSAPSSESTEPSAP